MKSVFQKIHDLVQNPLHARIILVLAVIAIFINILPNDFVMDDADLVSGWYLIQQPSNILRFFIDYIPPEPLEGTFSPVRTAIFSLIYTLFNDTAWGWHLTSIIIHVFGVLAVYSLIRIFSKNNWVPFLTALVFAIQPLSVGPVASVAGSMDSFGIVFGLWSFYWFIRAVMNEEGHLNIQRYAIAILLAALAVFTTQLMMLIPLLFFFTDFLFLSKKQGFKKSLRQVLPFFGVVLIYMLTRYSAFGDIFAGRFFFTYFISFIGSIVFVLVVVNIFQITERRRFFKKPFILMISGVMIFLAFRTIKHNGEFRDKITFHENAVRRNPENVFLKNELAILYSDEGRFDEAEKILLEALEIDPGNKDFYFSLAEIYAYSEKMDQAMTALEKAIAIDPDFAEAYFNLAIAHTDQGDEEQGTRLFLKAVDIWKRKGQVLEAGEGFNAFQIFLLDRRGLLKQASIEDF